MFLKRLTRPLWILGTRVRNDALITDSPENKGQDYHFHEHQCACGVCITAGKIQDAPYRNLP